MLHQNELLHQNNWQRAKILNSRQHQDQIFRTLNNQNYIRRERKRITLDDQKEYVEFISCSYLGLDQDQRVIDSVQQHLSEAGIVFASARTRMKYKLLDDFEHLLNHIFNAHTVIFSTTHLAHLGLIPLLASGEMPSVQIKPHGCHFLLDHEVHASVQINRGLMQQFGPVDIVDFHDLDRLIGRLKSIQAQEKTPFLFCDSVGSMGGVLPLSALLKLAQQYSAYLYVDDAHGMSVYGKHGAGYVLQHFGHLPENVILATSLAKGFGVCGGVIVLPSPEDAIFVKTYCSTYMFSGTLLNPLINAGIASGNIHLSSEVDALQKKLLTNIRLFDDLINTNFPVINFGSNSPIRGILIGDESAAIAYGTQLKAAGYLASTATYPICKRGSAMLRFTLCANHHATEIQQTCQAINRII